MSFVYAQKIGQSIAVFADTRIKFDDDPSRVPRAFQVSRFFGAETEKRVRQFGMIKNIIVSKNFCVCFAGENIIYANDLLQQIKSVPLEKLLQIALNINQRNPDYGAEFIICYAEGTTRKIFQIKGGICEDVQLAWIGSEIAFRYFRGVREGIHNTQIKSNIPYSVDVKSNGGPFIAEEDIYQSLFHSFFKTVYDCGDDSVGDFVVPALFEPKTNQFWYKGYCHSFTKMHPTSEGLSLPLYQGPTAGSFSIFFFQSPQNVGIYIPESHQGIIYNHYRPNPDDYQNAQTSAFLTPHVTKMQPFDFYVQTAAHGMSPPSWFLGEAPDEIDNYLSRVWRYKDKPELAILYIDKAIEIIEKQHRDEWRYNELLSIRHNIQAGL